MKEKYKSLPRKLLGNWQIQFLLLLTLLLMSGNAFSQCPTNTRKVTASANDASSATDIAENTVNVCKAGNVAPVIQ